MDLRTPPEVIEATLKAAEAKVATGRSLPRLLTLSVLAGAYIALGGILSVIVGYGFPGLTESNPALQRLLSGAMFPIGLILVVVLGAELFTGNNALLIPAFMSRRCTAADVARNWTLVYLGNFVGAILFTWLMVYAADGIHQGNRCQLVCMPGRMACAVGAHPAGQDGRMLAPGDGIRGPRLRALDSQHVLHPARYDGGSSCGRMAGCYGQYYPGYARQYSGRRAACGLCPRGPSSAKNCGE